MLLKANFELMADYNQWMNKSIYLAASKLSADELSKERGAFFGSIIGILNHIFVGDTIWLKRFADHPSELKALNSIRALEKPKSLDAILYHEFRDLESARIRMDDVIQEFAHELTGEVLASSLSYSNTKGEQFNKNLGHLIQHFFNHQTHHRGQVTTLLSQAGIDAGVTDLLIGIADEKTV